MSQPDPPPDTVLDEQASRYLRWLIEHHLEAIIETELAWPSNYEQPVENRSREALSYHSAEIANLCAEGSNAAFFELFKAAIRVMEDPSSRASGIAREFLERASCLLRGDTFEAGWEFVQSVLEQLLRRDPTNGFITNTSTTDERDIPPGAGMSISMGKITMDIPLTDVLDCFWTARLDTKCHYCHRGFGNVPPIRTVSAGAGFASSARSIHLRVFNRHAACLKSSNALVVPVSHVWSEAIRKAKDLGHYTADAGAVMFTSIHTLLTSAQRVYSPKVEFWHDYFSVPQWNQRVQTSLLLALPSIYHEAEEILVQMPMISTRHVGELFKASLLTEFSLYQCLRLMVPLRALYESDWMKRLWVTLEYSVCKRACIMDGSHYIWRGIEHTTWIKRSWVTLKYNVRNSASIMNRSNRIGRSTEPTTDFGRNTLSYLLDGCTRLFPRVCRESAEFGRHLSRDNVLLGYMAMKGYRSRPMCLGEAVELVKKKECQYDRDTLIAISIILRRNSDPRTSEDFPADFGHACRMVWKEAMRHGDFSALLLHHRNNLHSPSWLVSQQSWSDLVWDLGSEVESSGLQIIVNEDMVEARLDFVGAIEDINWLDEEDSGELASVDWTIDILARMSRREGADLSAKRLFEGFIRVFPIRSEDVVHEQKMTAFSFNERQTKDPLFGAKFGEQLEVYLGAPQGEGGRSEREDAAKAIAEILELEKASTPDGSDTRLKNSGRIAFRRSNRGIEDGEPICTVRCPGCSSRSLFRLDLGPTATIGARIYRIPGLTYTFSAIGGVGVVLQEGRIVGRMLYGAPLCDCRLPEVVQIR